MIDSALAVIERAALDEPVTETTGPDRPDEDSPADADWELYASAFID